MQYYRRRNKWIECDEDTGTINILSKEEWIIRRTNLAAAEEKIEEKLLQHVEEAKFTRSIPKAEKPFKWETKNGSSETKVSKEKETSTDEQEIVRESESGSQEEV